MANYQMCRKCQQRSMREIDPKRKLWECKCGARFVRLEDGRSGRWFAADDAGRAIAANGLSTRDGRVISFDPCDGYVYADGRPASDRQSVCETPKDIRSTPDLQTRINGAVSLAFELLRADEHLVDWDNPTSVDRWNERVGAKVAEIVDLVL